MSGFNLGNPQFSQNVSQSFSTNNYRYQSVPLSNQYFTASAVGNIISVNDPVALFNGEVLYVGASNTATQIQLPSLSTMLALMNWQVPVVPSGAATATGAYNYALTIANQTGAVPLPYTGISLGGSITGSGAAGTIVTGKNQLLGLNFLLSNNNVSGLTCSLTVVPMN